MTMRIFESAGQRIDINGNIKEVEITGAVKNQLLENAKKDYFDGDQSYMRSDKESLSVAMEQVFDDGKLSNVNTVVELLEELKNDKLGSTNLGFKKDMIGLQNQIRVTYKDDDFLLWNNGKGDNVQLTDKLLDKINDGSISHATITMGKNKIEIEEGKVISISDGLEDTIPQSVIDDAAKFGQKQDIAITVVPFGAGLDPRNSAEYMYINDTGNILTLATTNGLNGGIVRLDPNEPTHNPSGANGGATKIIGNNDGAPHIDNPTAIDGKTNLENKFNIASENENSWSVKKEYEREPFQLSYDKDAGIDRNEKSMELTTELQEKMLRLAELDPSLKIDLGNYGKNGVDGLYGDKTRSSVMVVEKYFGAGIQIPPTGVANENLLESIDDKINELESDLKYGAEQIDVPKSKIIIPEATIQYTA